MASFFLISWTCLINQSLLSAIRAHCLWCKWLSATFLICVPFNYFAASTRRWYVSFAAAFISRFSRMYFLWSWRIFPNIRTSVVVLEKYWRDTGLVFEASLGSFTLPFQFKHMRTTSHYPTPPENNLNQPSSTFDSLVTVIPMWTRSLFRLTLIRHLLSALSTKFFQNFGAASKIK